MFIIKSQEVIEILSEILFQIIQECIFQYIYFSKIKILEVNFICKQKRLKNLFYDNSL